MLFTIDASRTESLNSKIYYYKDVKLELDSNGNIKLYRAVSLEEYQSISETKQFSINNPSQMESKWMATSYENAVK